MKDFILNTICLVLIIILVILTPLRYLILLISAILDSKLFKHTKVYSVSVEWYSKIEDVVDDILRSIR